MGFPSWTGNNKWQCIISVFYVIFLHLYPEKFYYLASMLSEVHVAQLPWDGLPHPPSVSLPLTHAFGSHGLPRRLVASRVRACLQTGQTRPLLWDKHKTQTSINKQIHSYTPLPQNTVCTRSLISEHSLSPLSRPLCLPGAALFGSYPVHFGDLVSLLIDGVRESPVSPSDKALA